ncbi:MAG: hypothetical protein JXR10_00480 [Cyclobacteriaceae bacterium]
MSRISAFLLLVVIGFTSYSQTKTPGWNWPEDPEEERATKEKQAYYKILIQTDAWEESFSVVNWLLTNTPKLHESIYKDAGKIIEELLDSEIADERRAGLEDSLLWTYDKRLEYFDSEDALDRKAYTAFKMYYKNPDKYALLRSIYEELYQLESNAISDFNLTPYMTLATYYHKTRPKEFAATDVLDVHGTITSVIDEKIATEGSSAKLQKEQDKIDAFLNSLGNLISCEFIETQLLPKFNESPDNLNLAKKIFTYSLRAKCTDQPYFMKAGETLYKSEPSYSLAKALGDKNYFLGNYTKANQFYSSMLELADNSEKKHEALMNKASTASKQGNKKAARSYAREAISQKPGSKEAYNLIGNLYFLSFDECKAGTSKVEDRGTFIAAYEMYQKAGNTSQMAAAAEQFPSIEDIFNEGKEEGSRMTVGCWINESVTLRRRQ